MLNKVQLIGNITHDLNKQIINSNNDQFSVVNFQIAINKQIVKKQETTIYVPCTIVGKQADNMIQYLHKGSKIYVEGRLNIQQYTLNNEKRISSKVEVQSIIYLDNKGTEKAPQF